METLANLIDGLNRAVGEALKWLLPLIVLLAASVAILRYAFGIGLPWLSESYVWLNGAVFTLGAGYVLLMEKHVRVDFIYERLTVRGKAWVNILGTLLLLWPTMYIIAEKAWPAVERSWRMQETSSTVGGLPFMFLLKGCVIGFCVLVALQGLSLVLRSTLILRTRTGRESVHG